MFFTAKRGRAARFALRGGGASRRGLARVARSWGRPLTLAREVRRRGRRRRHVARSAASHAKRPTPPKAAPTASRALPAMQFSA